MDRERIIETLLLWNFWEKEIDTGIAREEYLKRLARYLDTDEVIVVTGVRRCGKSTILLQALAELLRRKTPRINTLYINFEDPAFYNSLNLGLLDEIWQAYLDYLKPKGRVYLVLDEVQQIKGWERWVRSAYDRKEKVKIFVTGSNAELLSSEFANVLTGRHLEVAVSPLTFGEFLQFKGIEIEAHPEKLWLARMKNRLKNYLLEYLKIGGFPKAVLTADDMLRRELLEQYFNDILTRDVAERHKIKDTAKLKNLALFYAANFTRGYSFNKVKKVADFFLSLDSIGRFSHYLEDSFLVQFLPRFSYSLKNQAQVQRKVYLVDNGIHNAVAFKFSEDKGKLLENAVYQHLRKREGEVYYFSEKKEVDFVYKQGLKVRELVNACYSLQDKETLLRECESLEAGMRYFRLKQALLIVAEGERRVLDVGAGKILVCPFVEWALSTV
ncbi:MAG: ATP-binding protein [Candidatus Omnitrophota bacterium]